MDHHCPALGQQLEEPSKKQSVVRETKSPSWSWFDKSIVRKQEATVRLRTNGRDKKSLLLLSSVRSSKQRKKRVQWLRATRDYSFLSNPGPGNTIKPGKSRARPEKAVDKAIVDKVSGNIIFSKKSLESRRRRESEQDIKKEDVKAIGIIRRMFGYDPTRFYGDVEGDTGKMEASFHDIEKEERRSAKKARREDAEELRKLEAGPNSKKLKHLMI